jgi:hypothetical protein
MKYLVLAGLFFAEVVNTIGALVVETERWGSPRARSPCLCPMIADPLWN